MLQVVEIGISLCVAAAAVWLPGAAVIQAAQWLRLRPTEDEARARVFPGPMHDL